MQWRSEVRARKRLKQLTDCHPFLYKIQGHMYDHLWLFVSATYRNIRDEALQSEVGKILLVRSGMAPDDISSIVLVEKDRSSIKSETVLRIMQYIQLPFPRLPFFSTAYATFQKGLRI